MPSPDVRRFVDLTLYDRESQSIYTDALNYARVALPEFQPREGSVEVVMLQAVAVEVAELVRSINRLPGGVVQVLLRLMDIQRSDGVLPTCTVQLSAPTNSEADIPSGVRMFYQSTLDAPVLVLTSDAAVRLTHTKSISFVSVDTNYVTVTTATRHGFNDGQSITLAGFASPHTALNDTFTVDLIDGTSFGFALTKADTTFTPSSATATPPNTHPATGFVTATGAAVTTAFNGLPAGTSLDLLSVVPQVASVKLATPVAGGALAENDNAYFSRAAAKLARMTTTLVTADSFTQWAAENDDYPYVYRATTLDATGIDRTASPGEVTLAVAPIDASPTNMLTGTGDPATPISSGSWGQKDEIRLAAANLAHADLTVSVVDPMLVTVKVETTVRARSDVSAASASNAIESTLASTISPNTWDWSRSLRRNELIGLISKATNDDGDEVTQYVVSVTTTVTDAHIPDTGVKTGGTVSSKSHSGGVLTVNTSATHGLGNTDTTYVALYCNGAWETHQITYVDADTFTVPRASDPSTCTEWALVATVGATTGDLTLDDPAPLLVSGAHEVTVT